MTAALLVVLSLALLAGVAFIGLGSDRLVEALYLRDKARALRGSRLVAWGVAVLLFVGLISSSSGPHT